MTSTNIQRLFISPIDDLNNKNHDILSDYNIQGIIGRGTFSIVKLGENKLTKKKVAIKIMQKNKIINQEELIRINREIEMLKCLNHPNVIKIYKILEDSKKFYIIMEFCENGELFNLIVEKQRLNEDEAALFYYQLINGLEYIHKNKIVHRDLKPENLLLSKDNILKIIDFGLSNYSKYNILLGTPCGSPCYASPEMVSGQKYNGFLIDIWSSGIILFAMICGYLPFQDNNNEKLFGKILKCKINYPKYISELALDIMKKILVPEPSNRITLQQIKDHQFYIKGKMLFNQIHPDINKIQEIIISNINLSNSGVVKNKENLVNNIFNNNIKNYENNILTHKNYNSENINYNFDYKINFIEDNNYNNIKNYDNYNNVNNNIIIKENKNDILDFNSNNYDFFKNDNNIIMKENKNDNFSLNIQCSDFLKNSNDKNIIFKNIFNNEKENIDENIQKTNNKNNNEYKIESVSINLNSDEMPKDSIPKDYKNNKKDINIKSISIINNMGPKFEDSNYKRVEEQINSINSTGIQSIQKNINNNIYNLYDKNEKSQRVAIKLGEKFIVNRIRKPGAEAKTPENNLKNFKNKSIKNNTNNKLKERIIIEYFPKEDENKSNTIDHSTILNRENNLLCNSTENNSYNKCKYSIITHQVVKSSYNNVKISSILEPKNKYLSNEKKSNFLSNSVPKNNDKANSYIENKYPHNNHNKINNTFIKKIDRKFQYNKFNNSNITNLKEDNNNIGKNINIINNNPNSNRIKSKINEDVMNEHQSNTIINEKKNKKKIFDIFNELKPVQRKEKIANEHNNNEKMINNYKINNIYENHYNNSLSVGKKMAITSVKEANFTSGNKKESNILNKFIYRINPTKKIRTRKKNIKRYDNNLNSLEYNKNTNNIINDNINKINNNTIDNNKLYLSHNSPFLYEDVNDTYFNTIALNNNNSINLNDSKYYIYVENNDDNKEGRYENLKTFSKNNKLRNLFKEEKKIPIASKYTNTNKKNNNNNTIDNTRRILNKRNNTNILQDKDYKNNNKLYSNNKNTNNINNYNDIYKNNRSIMANSGYHKNRILNVDKNQNKKLIEKLKNKKISNKNIYNLNDSNNKNNYTIKSNEVIFDSSHKNKEKNIRYANNKSIHIINNNTIINNINNINKSQITTKHIKSLNGNNNDGYIFKNIHNIIKTNVNKNLWSYDNEKTFNNENLYNNKYLINVNSPRNISRKNINIFSSSNFINKGKSLLLFDNIEHKPKLNKIKKINSNANIEDENIKLIVPKIHNTTNIKSLGNYNKLNTIVTDSTHSPLTNKNLQNIRNYKKFVKQYDVEK